MRVGFVSLLSSKAIDSIWYSKVPELGCVACGWVLAELVGLWAGHVFPVRLFLLYVSFLIIARKADLQLQAAGNSALKSSTRVSSQASYQEGLTLCTQNKVFFGGLPSGYRTHHGGAVVAATSWILW